MGPLSLTVVRQICTHTPLTINWLLGSKLSSDADFAEPWTPLFQSFVTAFFSKLHKSFKSYIPVCWLSSKADVRPTNLYDATVLVPQTSAPDEHRHSKVLRGSRQSVAPRCTWGGLGVYCLGGSKVRVVQRWRWDSKVEMQPQQQHALCLGRAAVWETGVIISKRDAGYSGVNIRIFYRVWTSASVYCC